MESLSTIMKSWTIQRRVLGALLLREVITRYGRHNIGFMWLFVEPMIFTLGITALWSFTKALHGSDLPITAFALTGYSSVLLWRNMPSRCIRAIEPNLSLLYHRNVRVIDIFLARIILEAVGATASFMILSALFISIGWASIPEDFLKVLHGWFMLAWFGAALAMFLGALSQEDETVEKLWHPVQYLMFPLSGAAFMVDVLPEQAQRVVLFLPMVHGVELIREGYFGSHVRAHYDMNFMTLCCVILTLLALAEVRKISRTVVPE